MKDRRFAVALVSLIVLAVAGCAGDASPDEGPLRVGLIPNQNPEEIEARYEPLENYALWAAGAGGPAAFLFGRVPQAASGFASLTLYQWECNIRSATILGFVGAGGIGQQILISMNLFDYPKVATLVGATMIVVLLVDRFSAAVRHRLVR